MIIWGRLLGTLFGFKLLGLLGAIIGYHLGGWFAAHFDPDLHAREYQSRTRTGQQSSYTHQPSHSDAYSVLGVASSASVAEIKKAYRRLMNQHHPDKLASKGLPESMIKMAKEKTQQISAAYDLIRQERGFR